MKLGHRESKLLAWGYTAPLWWTRTWTQEVWLQSPDSITTVYSLTVIVPDSKIRHRDTSHAETTVSAGAKDTHSECELSHPYDRYCRNPGDNNWLCYEGMLRIPLPPLKWSESENHLIHLTLIFSMASLSMGFSRQEYWSGLPYPPPGGLPNPRSKLESLMSPALAGWFFVISPPGKPLSMIAAAAAKLLQSGCLNSVNPIFM